MNTSIPLPVLLDQVKLILASQDRLPVRHQSSTQSPDDSTSDTNFQNRQPTILPVIIPPLPESATSLPRHTSSDPIPYITELLTSHVLPNLNLSSLSPRYFGFVTGGATPAALIADILASIYDQNTSVHLPIETISTNIEVAALNLLVELFDLPVREWGVGSSVGGGGGVITTGATASNVLGLALGRECVLSRAAKAVTGREMSVGEHGLLHVAREAGVEEVAVLSSMPHSSIVKAAGILGIGRANVLSIARDDDVVGVDVEKLERLARGAKEQRRAYILAVSTGEVNTGRFATDGIEGWKRIRSICDEHGIWIHVDGAFGLFVRALKDSSQSKSRANTSATANDYDQLVKGVEGIELADSITADGHKLLNVPYDCGLFFTRHKRLSEDVFCNGNAAYLTSMSGPSDGIQSPLNIGIENSRRFRALPAYATLMAYGREGYVDMLQRQIQMARRVVSWLWDREGYEVLPSAETKEVSLGRTYIIALFRAQDEELNNSLVKRINATGRIYVTGTVWDGKPAARLAVSNWQINVEQDGSVVEEVLEQVLCDFAPYN